MLGRVVINCIFRLIIKQCIPYTVVIPHVFPEASCVLLISIKLKNGSWSNKFGKYWLRLSSAEFFHAGLVIKLNFQKRTVAPQIIPQTCNIPQTCFDYGALLSRCILEAGRTLEQEYSKYKKYT